MNARRVLTSCVMLALPTANAAEVTKSAPKPVTVEQRVEVLAAALATSNARVSMQRLDLEYRQLRERLEAELKKAETEEQSLVTKLKKLYAAESCALTQKVEWDCKPAPEVGSK